VLRREGCAGLGAGGAERVEGPAGSAGPAERGRRRGRAADHARRAGAGRPGL